MNGMMSQTVAGNLSRVCPDCGTHLVNVAASGERYQCHDCDLHMVRKGDSFFLSRFNEALGMMPADAVEIQMTWQTLELARAV